MKNPAFLIGVLIVIAITAFSFLPSLGNDFMDGRDDASYVTENDAIKELSADNIRKIFTSGFLGHYCPIVMMSFAAEHHFFGLDPFYYHLSNFILHLLITALVFYFLYLISSGSVITAFVASLLFGIHPLQVEVVAWISERKELVCLLFYMLSLISYVKYIAGKKRSYYALSIAFGMLALFSKIMAVTIPFIFILLDYLYGRKIDRRSLLEKIPLVAAGIILGFVNLYFEIDVGATRYSGYFLGRVYFLSKTLFFYFGKLFKPVNLSAYYRYYHIPVENLKEIYFYIAGLVLLAGAVIYSRRYTKRVVFGSCFFLITILPTMELIPHGSAFAADRYMYFPSIGIFYMIALGIARILRLEGARAKALKALVIGLMVVIIPVLSVLTRARCRVWKDTVTLLTDVMKKDPTQSTMPYRNIGIYYEKKGDIDNSIEYFKKAVKIAPYRDGLMDNLERAYNNKKFLIRQEKGDAADVSAVGRDKAVFLNEIGVAQGKKGDLDGSIIFFEGAVKAYPDHAETYNNLGFAYFLKKDHVRAEENFKKALEIDPGHERAKINLKTMQGYEK
ncbi:tetratricopeptide repeat protein [Candidatus Omnitrophota bacterium]